MCDRWCTIYMLCSRWTLHLRVLKTELQHHRPCSTGLCVICPHMWLSVWYCDASECTERWHSPWSAGECRSNVYGRKVFIDWKIVSAWLTLKDWCQIRSSRDCSWCWTVVHALFDTVVEFVAYASLFIRYVNNELCLSTYWYDWNDVWQSLITFVCRCVLNWFGDWSTGALYQVGKEFTSKIDLEKTNVSLSIFFIIWLCIASFIMATIVIFCANIWRCKFDYDIDICKYLSQVYVVSWCYYSSLHCYWTWNLCTIVRLHWMHEMQTVVVDDHDVCLSVCLSCDSAVCGAFDAALVK